MLSIGELSRKTGVKIPTIRYYEQMGLVAAPERSEGNQRRYTSTELNRLQFIKQARDLGFKIDAIRELLELSAHPDQPCANANRIAESHLEAVKLQIAKLQSLKAELKRITSGCKNGAIEECYVIEALSITRNV
jgi:DNA-binding transcriptional MerR regulator